MPIWTMWRWVRGTVIFRAQGGMCEAFLTRLAAQSPPIAVWDIRRHDGSMTLCCRATDYRRLRPIAKRTGTRVRAQEKSGLPFVAKPLFARCGIVVGAAVATVLVGMLSSRIWVMDIAVDDPLLAARIEVQLQKSGVGIGTPMREVDIPTVRMHAIAQIEEIHQLSLYFDGSIARVGVQLQQDSAAPPDPTPANIVAAEDGRIVTLRATVGQPMVMEGEAVVKGDLLVCGAVETEKGTLLRHAEAVVLAQTTHVLEQRVSRQELLPREGRVIEQPMLRLFTWQIPLFSRAAFDDTWTQTVHKRRLTLFGVSLPVGIDSTVFTERIHEAVIHSTAEAEQLARERLDARAATELAGLTVDEATYDGCWEGEVYCLRATYKGVEDIARLVPLNLITERTD